MVSWTEANVPPESRGWIKAHVLHWNGMFIVLKDGDLIPPIGQASTDTVAKLLGLGATVDAVEKRRRTPLHHACERGRLDVVRYVSLCILVTVMVCMYDNQL